MTLTDREKQLVELLAKQLDEAKWNDTTVVCQMFSIEHARDLQETNLSDFTIFTKRAMVMKEPGSKTPSVHTIETTLRQGLKLAQWGVRMPDPWELRLRELERELEALTSEQTGNKEN